MNHLHLLINSNESKEQTIRENESGSKSYELRSVHTRRTAIVRRTNTGQLFQKRRFVVRQRESRPLNSVGKCLKSVAFEERERELRNR